jgi:hypothetical protein
MVTSKNLMNKLSEEYTFLFLGNTNFMGPPQREHAFANEIARRSYNVIFIEGMPSFGLKVKDSLYSFIFNNSTENKNEILPSKVSIYTPPLVPTFFRSSYTPFLDAKIFSRWFNKNFNNMEWNKTITIATFPYWWFGFFSRKKYPVRFIAYDICDSLEVHSRNNNTLNRMKKAEQLLIEESDLISYSAIEMGNKLAYKKNIEKICIPNAVSMSFFKEVQKLSNTIKTKIGFIGAFDTKWIDLELIEKSVKRFNTNNFVFVSPFRRTFYKKLSKYHNVELLGFTDYKNIPKILSEFKVAIIPFLKNSITDYVNPLKLYEYSTAGIPIIAIRTRELDYYSDIIELADSHEEFIELIGKSLIDVSVDKKLKKINFAEENTWSRRTDLLLNAIHKKMLGG